MTNAAAPPTQNAHQDKLDAAQHIRDQVLDVLTSFPAVELAVLFGSVVQGRQRPDSDIDIAVDAGQMLTAADKVALIEALAERTGRPIDLIDLKTVSEPLLGQIVRNGRRLRGSDSAHGQLISRHLFEQADFMPYRSRILAERRAALRNTTWSTSRSLRES